MYFYSVMLNIYQNFTQAVTLQNALIKDGRHLLPSDLSIIKNAAIVFDDNNILWVGESSKIPSQYSNSPTQNFSGKIILPEIIDCHTHLVFGGDRANEYTMRLNGASYEEIANAGGGIVNTMKQTRLMSRQKLFEMACTRVNTLASYGVGTIEIKSGYGLNFEKEYELSMIIHELKQKFKGKLQIINTFMAAHAIPKEFSCSSEYISNVVLPLLSKLAPEKILDAVDIFHEKNYFSTEDVLALFKLAQQLNIPCKMHVDEFYDNKGAVLAVQSNAISCDHLLMTGDDGVAALARSSTVACLLPGTGFFLGKPQAPARKFLDAGVRVAIGSDYNPGSCHCDNVLLIASLAAPQYKMNQAELFAAITLNAAHALGIKNQGALVPGLRPRFSIFNTTQLDNLTYHWGKNFFECH
ncbi:MAG TPA: imidazolonepropionase [Bacteriovoracaceae bacterium]|nr:imidazolonepropionase [Bacteriovoracaceae bacterium]